MKIALLNDLPGMAPNVGSGAELSIRAMALEGYRRGHEIDFFTPQNLTKQLEGYDLAILKNVTAFNEKQFQEVFQLPYVAWPSDYYNCPKYRLYYPMQEKCKTCSTSEIARQILLSSILNIFLSPLHQEAYEFVVPEVKDTETLLSPPYVDPKVFNPVEGVPRLKGTTISINTLLTFKGAQNAVQYASEHPEMTFNFVGGANDGWDDQLPSNAFYFSYAEQSALPALYSQASFYLELPDTPQPYNRTIAEAVLCGVPKFIVNKNVGAMSYKWMRGGTRNSVAKRMKKTLPELWDKLEGLV
ncbi:hypothetical protein KAR91_77835 [Candidatus Pacearchaeota archaeon]|nr:hypothetical protein [Candidatus Pacearchaeota archaeon]